jgi:hypothetical protein
MAANLTAQVKTQRPVRAKRRGSKIVARKSATGEFKVALKPSAIKALEARKAKVRALMEALGEGMDASRKNGRATRFLVIVDAKGQPSIKAEVTSAQVSATVDNDLNAALAAARERGRHRAADILGGDDMLSADAFAELLRVSKPTVHAKRQKHEVLALDGPKRGYRFPAWQIDQDGKPYAALPQLFEQLGDSAWTVYRFLTQRHSALDGITGLEALRRGEDEAVIETAEGIARGTFA